MIIFYIIIAILSLIVSVFSLKFLLPKGVLEIDYSKERPRWLFLLTTEEPTRYVKKHKYIVLKIKDVTDLVLKNESAEKFSANMRKEDNYE